MNKTPNEPAYQDTKLIPPDPQFHARDRFQTSIITAKIVDCMTKPNVTESSAINKTPNKPAYQDTELVPPDPQFRVHIRVRTQHHC